MSSSDVPPIGEAVQWPHPDAEPPIFQDPREAAAFIAEACGLTVDNVVLEERNPEAPLSRDSAWFAGIPATALFYAIGSEPPEFRPTEGASGIVRKLQGGELATEQLTTPYEPPRPALVYKAGDREGQHTYAGFGYGRGTPLLNPGEAYEDDPHDVAGTLEINESEDGELSASLVLEDGSHVPFDGRAVRDLTIADPDIRNLAGQQGVFRVENVTDANGDEGRMVFEVYFEGE